MKTTDCTTGTPGCIPYVTDPNNATDIAPEITQYDPQYLGLCPDYENIANCCNNFTMRALQTNFNALDLTFGSPAVGCPICAANLKRFWCRYTSICS